MDIAKKRASRLTDAEIAELMAPLRECAARLRTGVASELQHDTLHTALQIADCIEASGIVRGLREHIGTALQASQAIRDRAMATGTWRPTALYFYELDAIREALDLHVYQLEQLSAGELQDIVTKLKARTASAGGRVVQVTEKDLGLLAA
ncbi:hypothetical protein [Acidovorax sp. BLS4]|uniref:hypothetical protein n=1 Tax=Acidovorax sp. BLS4 TaxID=3273430 RepID=UPI002942A1F9|nr:hypothetical protein [Paracidovorax avenae]WOI43756.1 hypothetical protein R1Z03_14545 [Paracidovorax avenae]